MALTHLGNGAAGLKAGNHVCFVYESELEHQAVLRPFLRQGLQRREQVIYIAHDHPVDTIVNYQSMDGMELEPYLESGQLMILSSEEVYLPEEHLGCDKMCEFLSLLIESSFDEGYSGIRVSTEMSWILKSAASPRDLLQYEMNLAHLLHSDQSLVLCQYHQRLFPAVLLLQALATHPRVLVGNKCYHNAYFMSPPRRGQEQPESLVAHWIEDLLSPTEVVLI